MMNLSNFIKKEIENKGCKSVISRFSRKKEMKEKIIEKSLFLNEYNPSMSERIYCIVNNIHCVKKCKKCKINKVNFFGYTKGYSIYCSQKCSANSIDVRKKNKDTCIERYGFDSPMKNSKIKKKAQVTCIEKYGFKTPLQNKIIRNKIETTCIEKYGYKTPFQNEQIKNKIKNSVKAI